MRASEFTFTTNRPRYLKKAAPGNGKNSQIAPYFGESRW